MSLSFSVMQCLNCLFVEVFIKFALIWLEIISDIGYKLSLDLSLIQGCLIRIYSIVLYGLSNSFLTILWQWPTRDKFEPLPSFFSTSVRSISGFRKNNWITSLWGRERERGEFCNLLAKLQRVCDRKSMAAVWPSIVFVQLVHVGISTDTWPYCNHLTEQSSLILKLHIVK